METVILDTRLFHEFEGHAHAVFRILHIIVGPFPWADRRWNTEWIRKAIPKRVPVGHGEPQMLLHCLVTDLRRSVVVLESEGILGIRPLERNHRHVWKEFR